MAFEQNSETGSDPSGTLVSGDVRRHNLSVVARYLLDQGPASRSQIAAGTGLTRGSVTALTTVLLDSGVLAEVAPESTPFQASVDARAKGRPLTLLALEANHVAILALQLDADTVTGFLTTLMGKPLLHVVEHHNRPMGQPGLILDRMATVLGSCLDECRGLGRQLADMTVVVFAPVGGNPGIVVADTDLGWGSVDVIAELRLREPRLPDFAQLSADSTLAAQAELGLLPDIQDLVYLKSNSGIGGALISGGALVTGAHQLAGALGHLPLVPQGEQCACGQRGCLVTVAGPDEILRAAGLGKELASDGLTAALAELIKRIRDGEPRAVAAWEAAVDWISRALQILTLALDPQVIVLGGYWASLADSVAESFARNRPDLGDGAPLPWPDVVAGQLAQDAALMGAVWQSRDRLLRDPQKIFI